MLFIGKNKGGISHLNQNIKTLTCILIKKLISYCIIFETNMLIEMVIYLAVGCKSDTRQGKDYTFMNFQEKKI